MPTKTLTSQAGRTGLQKTFKFGGGANTVFAIDDEISPFGYIINGGGGNDTIYGSDFDRLVEIEDPDDPTGTIFVVGGDLLFGGDGSDTVVGGGGDDTIYGGNLDGSDASKGQNPAPTNLLVGDGERLDDGNPLTDDPLTADVIFFGTSTLFTGGDDVLNGGNASTNNMYGDAFDVNIGNGEVFYGGDDELNGGDGLGSNNNMFGDANIVTMAAGSTFYGGDDILTAGADTGFILSNKMVGDAGIIEGDGTFIGGDDTLYSGNGSDQMFGDWANDNGFDFVVGTATGGADTFVFGVDNGFDSIGDFEAGKDTIDLIALGITFGTFDTGGVAGVLDAGDFAVTIIDGGENPDTTLLDLGAATGGSAFQDLLFISNVTGLVATDFDFA